MATGWELGGCGAEEVLVEGGAGDAEHHGDRDVGADGVDEVEHLRGVEAGGERRPGVVGHRAEVDELVNCGEERVVFGRPPVAGAPVTDGDDLVGGDASGSGGDDVLVPFIWLGTDARDPEDGELDLARSEARAVEEVAVERQEARGEVGVVGEGAEDVEPTGLAGWPGCLGGQGGEGGGHRSVPLSGRDRRDAGRGGHRADPMRRGRGPCRSRRSRSRPDRRLPRSSFPAACPSARKDKDCVDLNRSCSGCS